MANERGILAAAALALLVFAAPAHATGEISCHGIENAAVNLSIGFGTLPVLSVISARIAVEDTVYQLRGAEDATTIRFGDGAFLSDGLIARFTDDIVNEVLAELRIVTAAEDRAVASVGILRLPGRSVHALICEGP